MNTPSQINSQSNEAALKYPLSLALVDYAPVIFTLIGQWLLVRAQSELFAPVYTYALLGMALIFSGGFSKATWKTIIAATEKDFRWMEHALFLLLAPGATLFGWAVWQAQQSIDTPVAELAGHSLLYPLLISVVFIAISLPRLPKSKKWFLPLVGLLTIAMGVIAVNAAMIANHFNNSLASGLFIASYIISLITAGVSRRAATINMQWIMEIANTLSAGVFVLAAMQLMS